MIAVDTNILVRYLVADDRLQAERAGALIEESRGVFVGQVVLCELVWVLEGAYGAKKSDLLSTLRGLLAADRFVVERPAEVSTAVNRWAEGKAGFSDYLLGEVAGAHGAGVTYTFDRVLSRSSGFAAA